MNRKQRRMMKAKGLIMPEQTVDPKEQETRAKYADLCAKLGHTQVAVAQLNAQAQDLFNQITELQKAHEANQKAKAEATNAPVESVTIPQS